MELYLSGLLTRVGVNVIDLDHLWYYLNDLYNSLKFISLDHIYQILLEEFVESDIAFLFQLWVLVHVFLHLGRQHLD